MEPKQPSSESPQPKGNEEEEDEFWELPLEPNPETVKAESDGQRNAWIENVKKVGYKKQVNKELNAQKRDKESKGLNVCEGQQNNKIDSKNDKDKRETHVRKEDGKTKQKMGAHFIKNSREFLERYKGRNFEIINLTSEKGLQLNGQIGTCTGYDTLTWRLNLVLNDGNGYKIKWENVIDRKDIDLIKEEEKLKEEKQALRDKELLKEKEALEAKETIEGKESNDDKEGNSSPNQCLIESSKENEVNNLQNEQSNIEASKEIPQVKKPNGTIPSLIKQEFSKKRIKKTLRLCQEFLDKIKTEGCRSEGRYDIPLRLNKLKLHNEAYKLQMYSHFLKCCNYEGVFIKPGSIEEKIIKNRKKCLGDSKFRINQLFSLNCDKTKAEKRLYEWLYTGLCVECQIGGIEIEGEDLVFKGRKQGESQELYLSDEQMKQRTLVEVEDEEAVGEVYHEGSEVDDEEY